MARSMGDLGLNIADVEEKDFSNEPIPNSTYFCTVERMEESEVTGEESKNIGAPKFNIGVSIAKGKYENRWVFDTLTMVQAALWKFKSFMKALGIDEDEYSDPEFWPTPEWIEENVIGRQLDVRVGIQPARGEYSARNKVNGYKPHKFTDDDLE